MRKFDIGFWGRYGLCVICLLICLTRPSLAVNAYDDHKAFKLAADLLNNGMYLEALGVYQEIENNSANNNSKARALLFLGTTYSLYLDQYEEAVRIYDVILNRYPESPAAPDAIFNTGMVYYEQGDFSKAYQTFIQYQKRFPNTMRFQSAKVWADSSKARITDAKPLETEPQAFGEKDKIVRVLLKNNSRGCDIQSGNSLKIIDYYSDKLLYHGKNRLTFSISSNQLSVNGQRLKTDLCKIKSAGSPLILNNKGYRGFLTVMVDQGRLRVVNYVTIEEYLYGVVPSEMPDTWNQQALRAQAVAARTYAMYIRTKSDTKAYDIEATTSSQVYGGIDAESKTTNMAVDATRGQVMMHHGRLIIAYYHADSGGYTEDAGNVWNVDIPYLKGVPDVYCRDNPKSQWQCFLTYDQIQHKLESAGVNTGKIKNIKVIGRSTSGRAMQLLIMSDKGRTLMTSNNFRIRMGGKQLKSVLFQMEPKNNGVLFKGKGYGHGVGMSQWGANNMAQAGYKYTDILKNYYRGIVIGQI